MGRMQRFLMLKEVIHIITSMVKELTCLTEDIAVLVCRRLTANMPEV
jgi:hypothetical protein